MDLINARLAKNPVNWLIVGSMAMIGLLAASLISSPLRT